jgi:hypothetical protein
VRHPDDAGQGSDGATEDPEQPDRDDPGVYRQSTREQDIVGVAGQTAYQDHHGEKPADARHGRGQRRPEPEATEPRGREVADDGNDDGEAFHAAGQPERHEEEPPDAESHPKEKQRRVACDHEKVVASHAAQAIGGDCRLLVSRGWR